MKILLSSHRFSPSIGGIETCSLALAKAFSDKGHQVRVLTQTASSDAADDQGCSVLRQPSRRQLLAAVRWCDIYYHNNISLNTAWPLLLAPRPWIVTTATWIRRRGGGEGFGERMKRLALRFAHNIYISQTIASHVGRPGTIIPNLFDNGTFRVLPHMERHRSLVFLGRLVTDKGCDILIDALARLRDTGFPLPLTIIGHGPEEAGLRSQVQQLNLTAQVTFTGPLRGTPLTEELNRHQILVVPSRWDEPFGVVALEGLACGCLLIGSSGGGLGDAIGPCGITFKNSDPADLTRAIREMIEQPEIAQRCREAAPAHLHRHLPEVVADAYLDVFKRALGKG